jgi:hypothetical protein
MLIIGWDMKGGNSKGFLFFTSILSILGIRIPMTGSIEMFRVYPQQTDLFDSTGLRPDNTIKWRYPTGAIEGYPDYCTLLVIGLAYVGW